MFMEHNVDGRKNSTLRGFLIINQYQSTRIGPKFEEINPININNINLRILYQNIKKIEDKYRKKYGKQNPIRLFRRTIKRNWY